MECGIALRVQETCVGVIPHVDNHAVLRYFSEKHLFFVLLYFCATQKCDLLKLGHFRGLNFEN